MATLTIAPGTFSKGQLLGGGFSRSGTPRGSVGNVFGGFPTRKAQMEHKAFTALTKMPGFLTTVPRVLQAGIDRGVLPKNVFDFSATGSTDPAPLSTGRSTTPLLLRRPQARPSVFAEMAPEESRGLFNTLGDPKGFNDPVRGPDPGPSEAEREQRILDEARRRVEARRRTGSSIATSPLGLTGPAPVRRKRLLGG